MSTNQPTNLSLRPWAENDLPLLERLMGDPAMMAHLGGPETPQQIRSRHARYCQISQTGSDGMFVILVGPEKLSVGSIGYWVTTWRGEKIWETGWSVLPEFQGQGFATQAASAVVKLVRAEAKYRFLHAFPSIENPPSNAICRKVGFIFLEEVDIEYPLGSFMRCNDWQLDLFNSSGITSHIFNGESR